ncbi:30S ribosome-binding factor RbfA [Jonesia quinghaiensis]|uniref:30S ribosome-binding factor RbfA n=1 Tax=Jonesia quinghaiensis TaxID=262806 RepID=UPI000400A63B|nr:30S ribosome-binding factor RbfA [Jonesia quinghaiensis]
MVDHPRARRLAERIQVIVAQMLEGRIKDPRLGFVTITDVRVTGDLQHASVFYTVLGDENERRDSTRALNSARGTIRSEVGRQVGIRLTPTIEFHLDAVPENAASFDKALHEAQQRDAELQRIRETAQYAAGEDPYRKPRELDSEAEDAPSDVDGDTEASDRPTAE